MKEVARGTAAVACLPSKEALNNAYFELQERIDQIVTQAEQQGSLAIAISGLNSIRHTLDSLMRLAGYDRPIGSQVNVAVQTNVNLDLSNLAERLIKKFDHEPEMKGRIAQALLRSMMNNLREVAYLIDPVLWVREVLVLNPPPWQERLKGAPRRIHSGADWAPDRQDHTSPPGQWQTALVHCLVRSAWLLALRNARALKQSGASAKP
jgi:hypothetical protein